MQMRAILFSLPIMLVLAIGGCESKKATEEAQKPAEPQTGAAPEETAPAEQGALMASADSAGKADNDEGVSHYQQGHWDVAAEHFTKAMAADPNLPVAHYNLALAMDKLGKHGEATEHFKKALELAPDDPAIRDSEILKAHVAG